MAPRQHRSTILHTSSKKFGHLDIHVGLFYHSEDAACAGYVYSVGAKRHFEYCPSDGNSLAGIPKVFLDRFNIGEMMAGQFYL